MTRALAFAERTWIHQAIRQIEADFQRSSDTHLFALPRHGFASVDIYLKDESSHPTGSLKHRLARSLFLYALCNGLLRQGSTVVEASSGSTAISEAYFARLLGLPFVAVVPATTSPEKLREIEFYGGRCELVKDASQVYEAASALARQCGGHYMDQFTYAERATDWRANNNIAESLFDQMRLETHTIPHAIIASAGTGGTLATLGRYVRYRRLDCEIVCADAEHSVFFDYFVQRDASLRGSTSSRIEGIGRPRVEPSFLPNVIDRMVKVPDILSIAAMRELSRRLGRRVGASTGTNLVATLLSANQLHSDKQTASLVTIICDGGERYRDTYYDDSWLDQRALHSPVLEALIAEWIDRGKVSNKQLKTLGIRTATCNPKD